MKSVFANKKRKQTKQESIRGLESRWSSIATAHHDKLLFERLILSDKRFNTAWRWKLTKRHNKLN